MEDHATEVALFRYSLVRELIDPKLSKAERGRRARALAGMVHRGPAGTEVRVSRDTIDRWTRALTKGGLEALVPEARHANPRTPAEVLELAACAGSAPNGPRRTCASCYRHFSGLDTR